MTTPRPSRAQCIVDAAQCLADGLAEVEELLCSGRADEAARAAGCRTPAEIDNWIIRNTRPLAVPA